MKKSIALILVINLFHYTGYGQNFKDIKPNLTDSTKIIKTEIKPEAGFERIYYIDYAKNSSEKKMLMKIDSNAESIKSSYLGILKNLKRKPQKINLNLPEKWFKIFKYKENWILFNDLPKFQLADSCLVFFDMDDPYTGIITNYKSCKNEHVIDLEFFNWENPGINLKNRLILKIIDPKKMIAI